MAREEGHDHQGLAASWMSEAPPERGLAARNDARHVQRTLASPMYSLVQIEPSLVSTACLMIPASSST